MIDGDAWQYLQFFYRLLNNTLQHAFKDHHQHRELLLQLKKQGQELQLLVKDNGVGLSASKLEQLRHEMQQKQCTGTLSSLNLWIKDELKGELNVKSELNQGTRIECHWPLSKA